MMDNGGGDSVVDVSLELVPCNLCGRTFLPVALLRHEKICHKTFTKRRKVFDSFNQRANVDAIQPLKPPLPLKEVKAKKEKPKWKEKHEELIRTIRAAKGVDVIPDGDGPLSPKQKYIPSDYIQCPSCERHFNQRAADRHIPWCHEQKTRIPKSPASSEAMERLKARTKYRAPLPGGKKKDGTPEEVRRTTSSRSAKLPKAPTTSYCPPHSSPAPLGTASSSKCSMPNSRESNKCPRKTKLLDRRMSPEHDIIRSREFDDHNYMTHRQSVKFKEKFPNRNSHRPSESDKNYDHCRQELQFGELSKGGSLSHAPRTVPGVRTAGHLGSIQNTNNSWLSNRQLNNKSDDELSLLQMKLADLGSSNGYLGDYSTNWAKRLYNNNLDNRGLPEVSSSDSPPIASREHWASDGDARLSTSSSSDSSLPPLSRGSSSESRLPRFCYHCGTKYPIPSAKYCCECGARRLGVGVPSSQNS